MPHLVPHEVLPLILQRRGRRLCILQGLDLGHGLDPLRPPRRDHGGQRRGLGLGVLQEGKPIRDGGQVGHAPGAREGGLGAWGGGVARRLTRLGDVDEERWAGFLLLSRGRADGARVGGCFVAGAEDVEEAGVFFGVVRLGFSQECEELDFLLLVLHETVTST